MNLIELNDPASKGGKSPKEISIIDVINNL